MKRMSAQSKDEKGHLVASALGGPAQLYNMVPQAQYSNQHISKSGVRSIIAHWHEMEDEIRKFVGDGCGIVQLTVIPSYINSGQLGYRPKNVRMNIKFIRLDGKSRPYEVELWAPNPLEYDKGDLSFPNAPKQPKNSRSKRSSLRQITNEIILNRKKRFFPLLAALFTTIVRAVVPVVVRAVPQIARVAKNVVPKVRKVVSTTKTARKAKKIIKKAKPVATRVVKNVPKKVKQAIPKVKKIAKNTIDKARVSGRSIKKWIKNHPDKTIFIRGAAATAGALSISKSLTKTGQACELQSLFESRLTSKSSMFDNWSSSQFSHRKKIRIEDSTRQFIQNSFIKRTFDQRVIAYSRSWDEKDFTAEMASKLTHVIYAFADFNSNGLVSIPETRSDKLYQLIYVRDELNKVGHNLQVIVAVGGWENSQYFSQFATSDNFVNSLTSLISKYNLDGLDIDWEYPSAREGIAAQLGRKEDKGNYVILLKKIRSKLDQLAREKGRKSKYLLTIASAAGSDALTDGFNLLELAKVIDWFHIMSYDFNGAWNSKWGTYTGPNAPLFHSSPKGRSGKLNVNWAVKYYYCRMTKNGKGLSDQQARSKITMGIPFYGRYWNSILPPDTSKGENDLYRRSSNINDGGHATYNQILNEWINLATKKVDEKSKTPYLMKGNQLLSYDDSNSIKAKVGYSKDKKLGGVMIWSVEDDSPKQELLNSVISAGSTGVDNSFQCPLFEDQRWWESPSPNAGMCGKYAPLYNGYYPICNPDDDEYGCCSKHGYCGSGDDFCSTEGSIDYKKSPQVAVAEPVRPSRKITWHLITSNLVKPGEPRCGPKAPKLENGNEATCNPDDKSANCCSPAGYCGKGADYCDCNGCKRS